MENWLIPLLSIAATILICYINNSRLSTLVQKELVNYNYRITAINKVYSSISKLKNWLYQTYGGSLDSDDLFEAMVKTNIIELEKVIEEIYCNLNDNRIYLEVGLIAKIDKLVLDINRQIKGVIYDEERNREELIVGLASYINGKKNHEIIDNIISDFSTTIEVFKKRNRYI